MIVILYLHYNTYSTKTLKNSFFFALYNKFEEQNSIGNDEFRFKIKMSLD